MERPKPISSLRQFPSLVIQASRETGGRREKRIVGLTIGLEPCLRVRGDRIEYPLATLPERGVVLRLRRRTRHTHP